MRPKKRPVVGGGVHGGFGGGELGGVSVGDDGDLVVVGLAGVVDGLGVVAAGGQDIPVSSAAMRLRPARIAARARLAMSRCGTPAAGRSRRSPPC